MNQPASRSLDDDLNTDLKKVLEHFDKVYVLTLRSTPQRQHLMRQVLAGIEFEFVYGADKTDFSLDELERRGIINTGLILKHQLQGRMLKPGMIGCSLSHKMLYEKIAASSFKRVLILEDDLELAPHNIGAVIRAIAELPHDWELLYLDYWEPARPSLTQRLVQVKHAVESMLGRFPLSVKAILRRFTVPYSAHLLKPGYLFYTSAYAITPAAARTLLRLQSPVSYAPDHLLGKACTENLINAFAVKDKLFEQYSMRVGESLTR